MHAELIEDFYIEELNDIRDAEKQLLKMLPRMAQAATSPDLKTTFEQHAFETENQIRRLEQVFSRLHEPAKRRRCKAMAQLLKAAEEFLGEDAVSEVIDLGLITAAQKAEHYEIASYGSLTTFARLLGHLQDEELLGQTLQEEKLTHATLASIAQEITVEMPTGETPRPQHGIKSPSPNKPRVPINRRS